VVWLSEGPRQPNPAVSTDFEDFMLLVFTEDIVLHKAKGVDGRDGDFGIDGTAAIFKAVKACGAVRSYGPALGMTTP
jgi:hypothetical protein